MGKKEGSLYGTNNCLLEKVSDISNHIILVGDLNVDFLTFQTPINSMELSLRNTIVTATRIKKHAQTH